MTGGYRDEYAFKRYTETPHGDLQLPGLSFRESDNRAAIYPGEIHCRAPHCSKTYKTTNALRKHYAATHDDIMLVSMAKGGRPSGKEEAAAIIWYHQIIAKLDSDQAAKAIIDPQLPALPLQKKGDAVSPAAVMNTSKSVNISHFSMILETMMVSSRPPDLPHTCMSRPRNDPQIYTSGQG
ncbi:hypothetical protein N7454_006273 [Penicillium verhagenii]|nr:hypothetical protein N7454_006273 [Penicillium verhagenii]